MSELVKILDDAALRPEFSHLLRILSDTGTALPFSARDDNTNSNPQVGISRIMNFFAGENWDDG